ncbi:MAG: hypothetical protein ACYDCK_04160 [Thermoplasmatota archaeon]
MTSFFVAFPAASAAGGCLAAPATDATAPAGEHPGFPGWRLVVGEQKTRMPVVHLALASDGHATCDLTHGLDQFLAGRASATDPVSALALARLGARVAFIDTLPDLADPASVGIAAAAPRIVASGSGYDVTFTTWTQTNGVLASWNVHVDGATVAPHFAVLAWATGPFVASTEGWMLRPGSTDALLAGPSIAADQLLGANADGSQWRINYFGAAELADAQIALAAAQSIYTTETGWGFASADPDRVLDITLDGCDCIYGGFNADIHIDPDLGALASSLGLVYPSREAFTRIVIGHETFHHMQYSIQQWKLASGFIEGGARFSETVLEPDSAFGPSTIQYLPNINGFSNMMIAPNTPISGRLYDFGLVWGFLYSRDGGMAFIHRMYVETNNVGSNADTDGPKAIDNALAAMTNPTDATFQSAYNAYANHAYARDFVWGDNSGGHAHNWGAYLPAITRTAPTGGAGAFNTAPKVWGIIVGNLGSGHDVVVAGAADPTILGTLATTTSGVASFQNASPGAAATGVDDAALLLVRGNAPNAASLPVAWPTQLAGRVAFVGHSAG